MYALHCTLQLQIKDITEHMKRQHNSITNPTSPTSLQINVDSGFSDSGIQTQSDCVCQRKCGIIQCTRCNHLFNGRISTVCSRHSRVTYLMDVRCCFYCMAPINFLVYADTNMQQVKKYEDFKIPDETNSDW